MSNPGDSRDEFASDQMKRFERDMGAMLDKFREFAEEVEKGHQKLNAAVQWRSKQNEVLKLKILESDVERLRTDLKTAKVLRSVHGGDESERERRLRAMLEEMESRLEVLREKLNPKRWWQVWRWF